MFLIKTFCGISLEKSTDMKINDAFKKQIFMTVQNGGLSELTSFVTVTGWNFG